MVVRDGGVRLRGALVASALLHASFVAAIVMARPGTAPVAPPMYRVNLVAAPPGPRQIGVVRPPAQPAPEPPTPATPPPRRAESRPTDMPAPAKPRPRQREAPAAATPTPEATTKTKQEQAPPAGGGPSGGKGADVANVRTEGIEFPFPEYLSNVVRQIALRFKPAARYGALRAEVFFIIRRDGTVDMSSFRFLTRSGAMAFDLEAQGAVEAAATSGAFRPLPSGYGNDFLPVIFSFDPQILR
jgi:protein TonB